MKGLLIAALILVWLGVLYFGYIKVIGRTMQSGQPHYNTSQNHSPFNDQWQKSQDLQQQQRHMLEDRQHFLQTQQDQDRF